MGALKNYVSGVALPSASSTVDITSNAQFGGDTPSVLFVMVADIPSKATKTAGNNMCRGMLGGSGLEMAFATNAENGLSFTQTRSRMATGSTVILINNVGGITHQWTAEFITDGVRFTQIGTGASDIVAYCFILGGDAITHAESGLTSASGLTEQTVTMSTGLRPDFIYTQGVAQLTAGAHPDVQYFEGWGGNHQGLGTIRQSCVTRFSQDNVTTAMTEQSSRDDVFVALPKNNASVAYEYYGVLTEINSGNFKWQPYGSPTSYGFGYLAIEFDRADRVEIFAEEMAASLTSHTQVHDFKNTFTCGLMNYSDENATENSNSGSGGQSMLSMHASVAGGYSSMAMQDTDNVGISATNKQRDRQSNGVAGKFMMRGSGAATMTPTYNTITNKYNFTSVSNFPPRKVFFRWFAFTEPQLPLIYKGTNVIEGLYKGSTSLSTMYKGSTPL